MKTNYWSQALGQRIGRRRVLATSAGAATAAAILAACGGGKSGSGGSGGGKDKAGLVAQPVDTLKTAKRTGTMKSRNFADPQSLDVTTPNNPITPFQDAVYNCLVKFEPGYMKPTENVISPERDPDEERCILVG